MTDTQNNALRPDILDEIQQEADQDLHPFLKKILDNIKPIGMGIGAIILVVGAYSGYTTYAANQATQLNNTLGTILIQKDSQKQIASLHDFLQNHPSAMPVGTLIELANISMKSKDYTEAADAWGKVAAQTDKEIKILALMGQARALSLQEKFKEALAVLDSIDPLTSKEFATPIARQTAFAAEQAKDWKKALSSYEELKTEGASTNTAFLDMKIADIKTKLQS